MCGVPLLGKSLGGKDPLMRFGIDCDQAVLQRKQNQIRVAFQLERHHDMVLVELHGFFAQVENRRNFFHGPSRGKQLCEVALSLGQFF
jgi:hypothetical protein